MQGKHLSLFETVVFLILIECVIFGIAAKSLADSAQENWVDLDRVVAEIEGRPVLLSEIMIERDLGLLSSEEVSDGLASLQVLYLNRLMILEEVRDVGDFEVSKEQLQDAYEGYLVLYESRRELDERMRIWGIMENEVKRRLTQALTASLYTESRVKFFLRVLPSDIEEAFLRDPQRWEGKDLDDAYGEIKRTLEEEAFSREMERWLESLRRRYKLIVFNHNSEEIN